MIEVHKNFKDFEMNRTHKISWLLYKKQLVPGISLINI